MSDDMDGAPPADGRVGFRDIYRAVGESEARIVAALNAAISPLMTGQTDHELRLRVIELAVAPLAVAATERERRLTALEIKADTTETKVDAFTAREGGVFATLGVGKSIVIVSLAIMGTAVAVAGFLADITAR